VLKEWAAAEANMTAAAARGQSSMEKKRPADAGQFV
jgi:hypothetical protein